MADKTENPLLWLLLGRWLGHPLHPAVVHVPIACWAGALIFDILNWAGVGGNALVRGAFYLILVGLLSTLLVVPAGIAEWTQIKREKPAWKLALWHALLNVITAVIFLVSLLLRTGSALRQDVTPLVPFVLCIAGTIILSVSGHLGGRMVYEHGIAVARMSKKKWRHIAEEGGANLPPIKT